MPATARSGSGSARSARSCHLKAAPAGRAKGRRPAVADPVKPVREREIGRERENASERVREVERECVAERVRLGFIIYSSQQPGSIGLSLARSIN